MIIDKWHCCVSFGKSETQNSSLPFLSLFLFTFQIANDFVIEKEVKLRIKMSNKYSDGPNCLESLCILIIVRFIGFWRPQIMEQIRRFQLVKTCKEPESVFCSRNVTYKIKHFLGLSVIRVFPTLKRKD